MVDFNTINKMMKISTLALLVAIETMVGVTLTLAQLPNQQDTSRPAQYFLGSQDQVLMAVNVWGFVHRPGQYMVPYDTDLISLLSFAGGPKEEAKIKNIRVVRADKKDQPQVIEVDVKKYLKTGSWSDIPVLKPGDTVVVSGTSFHFIGKFFEFAIRIAALIQIWALVDYYLAH